MHKNDGPPPPDYFMTSPFIGKGEFPMSQSGKCCFNSPMFIILRSKLDVSLGCADPQQSVEKDISTLIHVQCFFPINVLSHSTGEGMGC